MTIDSGWTKILKTNVPRAFSTNKPAPADVVFIDGQVKLMKADYIKTWKLFVQKQFIDTIDRCFADGSAVVVLAFDNYKHVPKSKHMTQRKRSQHVPVLDFEPGDDLPPTIPDRWDSAMRNRSFKVKVISMVVNYIRHQYQTLSNKCLLIDYQSVDVIGHMPTFLTHLPVLHPEYPGRGECDVKAFAYVGPWSLLIMSTDGDFIPMSLVQLERYMARDFDTETSIEPVRPAQIFIMRMFTSIPEKKTIVTTKTDKSAKKARIKNPPEYVNMNAILHWTQQQLLSTQAELGPARKLAVMIACTGCDFAMSLPQIGPLRYWQHKDTTKNIDFSSPNSILQAICVVYTEVFLRKHTHMSLRHDNAIEWYENIYRAIHDNIGVSARIKAMIWPPERMMAHAKNTYWTSLYWTDLERCVDPLSGDYGFQVNKGKTVYVGHKDI